MTPCGDIGAGMETRVRRDGQDGNRATGHAVRAVSAHGTSRPVDGVPDPHAHVHVHVHACAADPAFDAVEEKWRAGQFRDLKRHAPLSGGRVPQAVGRGPAAGGIRGHRQRAGF